MREEGTDLGGSILPVVEIVPWSEQYLQDMHGPLYGVSLDNLLTCQGAFLGQMIADIPRTAIRSGTI